MHVSECAVSVTECAVSVTECDLSVHVQQEQQVNTAVVHSFLVRVAHKKEKVRAFSLHVEALRCPGRVGCSASFCVLYRSLRGSSVSWR